MTLTSDFSLTPEKRCRATCTTLRCGRPTDGAERDIPKSFQRSRLRYTRAKLALARIFADRMSAPGRTNRGRSLKRAPLLVLAGRGQKTLARARWSGQSLDRRGIWNFNNDDLFADGDGTVTLDSAKIPDAFKGAMTVKSRVFDLAHAALFADGSVLRVIREHLERHQFSGSK